MKSTKTHAKGKKAAHPDMERALNANENLTPKVQREDSPCRSPLPPLYLGRFYQYPPSERGPPEAIEGDDPVAPLASELEALHISRDQPLTSGVGTDDPPLLQVLDENTEGAATYIEKAEDDDEWQDMPKPEPHDTSSSDVLEPVNNENVAHTKPKSHKKKSKKFKNRRGSRPQKAGLETRFLFDSDIPPPGSTSIAASMKSEISRAAVYNVEIEKDELDPGVDILFRIRIYKGFDYDCELHKNNVVPDMTNAFYHDLLLSGRHKVSDIKDRFLCSEIRKNIKNATGNGFLFIQKSFYVDVNKAANDHVGALQKWCAKHELGNLPKMNMHNCRLDQLPFKLGNPNVYVHDYNCEHEVIFTEVRLLEHSDPRLKSKYPRITAIAHDHPSAFCFNCAALNPKWIVSECALVTFYMALLCDKCYRKILLDDNNKKICKFKLYPYLGAYARKN